MAGSKPDMSCARVSQCKSSNVGASERHNERKNESYENLNVVPERIPMNVHFVDPGEKSYMEILRRLEAEGKVSLRGLRQDATLFDEIVIDVNTMYFERNGGYEYAKEFYRIATDFLKEKFGADYVISAVMHADELNKAATEELRRDTYHYHLHAMVLPVVEKEIRWSKRCKDPALVGTVKEVVHQISHSKKWAFEVPELDADGNQIYRKNGKPRFRPSYSVLQDELFSYMQEHGYKDFQRGKRGSTAVHLESLQYQILKDKERLAEIEAIKKAAELEYAPAKDVVETMHSIDEMGSKTLTGKVKVEKADFDKLTALAKEGVTSRGEIGRLRDDLAEANSRASRWITAYNRLEEKYDALIEKCKPFLDALEHFPDMVKSFVDKVTTRLKVKELYERTERAREYRREEREYRDYYQSHGRHSKDRSDDWER